MSNSPRICDECKGLCQALIPEHNKIRAAEWYCEKCHKSYPYFTEEEIARIEKERNA